MPEPLPVTAEELERLRAELERLKTEGRRQVREHLARARSFGDFRENAEFEQAKRDQATLEGRILELERLVGRAVVTDHAADRITVGGTVTAADLQTGENITFSLQAIGACAPGAIAVTPDSPIGRALMGRQVLDQVEVATPAGKRRLQIVSITRG